jgi:hypothetical protein
LNRKKLNTDMDFGLWGDGNNSVEGIAKFIAYHKCNEVCNALRLLPPEVIYNCGSPEVENITSARKKTTSLPKQSPIWADQLLPP